MRVDDPKDPAFWDAAAASYAAQAEPFTEYFAAAALAALPVGPGFRLLDIATGTGSVALAAARAGAEVVAIDFSAGMIAQVRAKGFGKLRTEQMDGQALTFGDACFDAAVSNFGIFLFPDWRAGLREMARVIRPGGSGVMSVWKSAFGAASNLLIGELRRHLFPDEVQPPLPFPGVAALCEPAALAAEMVAAGFQPPSVAEVSHDFRLRVSALDDADTLFRQVHSWASLAPDRRSAVLAEIRRRAARDAVDGVLPIPSTALIATARRL